MLLVNSSGLSSTMMGNAQVSTASRIAPDFTRYSLTGRRVNLSSFQGKVVLLNFWASWCGPCLTEIPRFVDWQREYGTQGLEVIGISMDDEDTPARRVTRRYGINFPVVMGDEKLGELYGGVLGLPDTFLIDRHGNIRFRHQGAIDLKVMEDEINSLLRTP